MYNIRKKLWLVMLLLFAASTVLLKIYPTGNSDAPALPADAAVTAPSDIFSGDGDRFAAHRGYSRYAPENSIPAFELAGRNGFWGIETDIYETTDGAFVCMHDEELDRTTNGTGAITDYSLEELSAFQIDAGSNVEISDNLKIPTFEEYLEICMRYGCVAVIEIKTVRNYDALLNIIYASGAGGRSVVMGNINDMLEIRARDAQIPVMTIGYTPAPYTDSLAEISQISENRGVLYNYPQADKAVIDLLHQQNMYCGVWSVDDEAIADEYLAYGADFVVTNELPPRLSYMSGGNE